MPRQQKEEPVRIIYKKNEELSKGGFSVFELAQNVESELRKKYPEPGHRVRNRYRSRTNTWDVVVKVRTEVKEPKALSPRELQAAKDTAFIAQHALTGE